MSVPGSVACGGRPHVRRPIPVCEGVGVPDAPALPGKLLAISDLHVGYPENRRFVADLWPRSPQDWLLVAGDVAEKPADIEWALGTLSRRFSTVIWTPGNHELWTVPSDPVQLRGVERYQYLVGLCRGLGVITPEDPYPVWRGAGGPAVVVPLFLLYDYTFLPPGQQPRPRRWPWRIGPVWFVPTKPCFTPTLTRPGMRGAAPGSRTPSSAWRTSTRNFRRFW